MDTIIVGVMILITISLLLFSDSQDFSVVSTLMFLCGLIVGFLTGKSRFK